MNKRKISLCFALTALLLLSLASVSLTGPLMPDRTIYQTADAGSSAGHATPITGAVANIPFDVTTDATTTAVIPLKGLLPWRVVNESGSSATLTFYDALAVDGTALTTYDEDGVAIAAITVGDDCSHALPSALAGCTCLVIKGGSAASGFTLICRR